MRTSRPHARLLIGLLALLTTTAHAQGDPMIIHSPKRTHTITFVLEDGALLYRVDRGDTPIVLPSQLGLKLDGADLTSSLTVTDSFVEKVEETWTQPWGETAHVENNYTALHVELRHTSGWRMNLHFRAYDDGVAFRYELPEQERPGEIHILDEITEFRLAGDHRAWWIPAYQWNRYEYLYENTPISEVDTVHTPVTMETAGDLYLSIHEAALTDFASMTLANRGDNLLACDLVPWSDGIKVRGELPIRSPWRTIQIADTPGGLITSYLILNCNEPGRIEDTSWIKPGKYIGIWWAMHLGTATWGGGEKHGATTQNTRRYIDFAAKHGFDGVLVEGWNLTWDGDWMANADTFSFTEPYPDYDLKGMAEYARSRGVRLIAHNETSGGILNYENQMEEAFALYRELGMNTIKSGYVQHGAGIRRLDPETGELLGNEWHHGQYMVRHYRKVVETAAKHHIMLDVHEPIKATGIRRTWPNMMTREGARGQEFNAWGPEGGNPPGHVCILPFTRLLGGPMDYTPGIFDLLYEEERPENRVNSTLINQLALYVVLYSPLHMAADLPENYEGHPFFQFIVDVPVDWSETLVLNGEIGEYVTFARRERDTKNWYIGGVTNEEARDFKLVLDFLEPGRTYRATLYADARDADWVTNPYAYTIETITVKHGDTLPVHYAPGGGIAIQILAK